MDLFKTEESPEFIFSIGIVIGITIGAIVLRLLENAWAM